MAWCVLTYRKAIDESEKCKKKNEHVIIQLYIIVITISKLDLKPFIWFAGCF